MKRPEKPLVSICIPNYNYARYIGAAVESALAQTYENTEIIVSDNCSTDGSLSALAKYEGNPKIKIYQNEKNVGIADNHNIAASRANGEYFVLLSSDDMLSPRFVERTLDIFLRFEGSPEYDIGLVVAEKDTIDERGNITEFAPFYASDFVCGGEAQAKISMFGNPAAPSFCLTKKTAFLKTPGFQKQYGTAHDWGLFFDLNMVSDFGYVREKLGLYRVHSGISTRSVQNFRYICNIHDLKLDMAERVKDSEYLSQFTEQSVKNTSSQALKWAIETLKNGKYGVSRKYLTIATLFDKSCAENPQYKKALECLSTDDPADAYLKAEKTALAVKPRTEPYPYPEGALIL